MMELSAKAYHVPHWVAATFPPIWLVGYLAFSIIAAILGFHDPSRLIPIFEFAFLGTAFFFGKPRRISRADILSALRGILLAALLGATYALAALIFGHRLPARPVNYYPLVQLVLLAPVYEEALFQGSIQTSLLQRFPNALAILLTVSAFLLLHGSAAPSLIVSGLLFAWLRMEDDSLISAIAAHSTVNALIFFTQ